MISTTTVWAIWRARNNIIFNEGIVEADNMVEEVKVLSWRWGYGTDKNSAVFLL